MPQWMMISTYGINKITNTSTVTKKSKELVSIIPEVFSSNVINSSKILNLENFKIKDYNINK